MLLFPAARLANAAAGELDAGRAGRRVGRIHLLRHAALADHPDRLCRLSPGRALAAGLAIPGPFWAAGPGLFHGFRAAAGLFSQAAARPLFWPGHSHADLGPPAPRLGRCPGDVADALARHGEEPA